MKKFISIFIPVFLILAFVFSYIQPFVKTSESISDEVFRLHIIANSDSEDDQKLKLLVRDRVLEEGRGIFENCDSLEDIILKCRDNLDILTKAAEECVSENGYDYDVNAYIDKEYFNTREYESITLPSGIYNALKIEIGEAKGHNWWCVMFPAICLYSVSETELNEILTEEEVELINSNNKYEIRFKVVEIYEKIKDKIS